MLLLHCMQKFDRNKYHMLGQSMSKIKIEFLRYTCNSGSDNGKFPNLIDLFSVKWNFHFECLDLGEIFLVAIALNLHLLQCSCRLSRLQNHVKAFWAVSCIWNLELVHIFVYVIFTKLCSSKNFVRIIKFQLMSPNFLVNIKRQIEFYILFEYTNSLEEFVYLPWMSFNFKWIRQLYFQFLWIRKLFYSNYLQIQKGRSH